ncbi:hypothetical protein FG379_002933 [Cryptosporidium bovis]|uniref:uncharacterized protein n=1 Tax=Cryptosporidium bovis TaxID=310047 RepID=UPI00351A7DAF|nr:hypothetical protein FG379_002933 [Cryptosporidium bovis]
MNEKSFEVFNIETILRSKWVDYEKNMNTSNDFIITPSGILRPLVIFNGLVHSKNFKLSWEYFFFKFISKIKEEMKNGLLEILSTINSSEESSGSNELPVVVALSGTNVTDHSILFGILDEFLSSSNGTTTITLDHEEIGIDGLNLSKIIDTIWNKIKKKYLGRHNNISNSKAKLGIKYNINNFLKINSLFEGERTDISIPDENETLNTFKQREKRSVTKRDNVNILTEYNNICSSNYLKSLDFYDNYRLFNKQSRSDLFDPLTNPIFNIKHKDLSDASKGFKILEDIYSKRTKSELKYGSIVLLLPGAECFSPGQLYRLLEVTCSLRESYKIPFVVILGVSTNIIYIQQIIDQITMKRLKVTTTRLLDSRKVFFKSILDQLIVGIDNIFPDVDFIGKKPDFSDLLDTSSTNKNCISKGIQLIPFLPSATLRQIKDNFFQQDFCLSSTIRTIFLIFQDYFSNNELGVLTQKVGEISQNEISATSTEIETMDYNNSQIMNIRRKRKNVKDTLKNELCDFKDTVLKIRLGVYFINIVFIELDLSNINERYNQLINLLELIERREISSIDRKLMLFQERIKGVDDFEKRMESIFIKINTIIGILFTKQEYIERKSIPSELFDWRIETFRRNLYTLLTYDTESNPDTLNYKNKLIFKPLTRLDHYNGLQDIYIDESVNPVYLFDTFKKLIQLNYEKNAFVDYVVIYQLLESFKGQSISLYDLSIQFFRAIYEIKSESTYSGKINIDMLRGKFNFINKLSGISFSEKERYLIERYISVISTFQLIGIISIYRRIFKRSICVKNECSSIKNIDSLNCQQNSTNTFSGVFRHIFEDIYARKIHWGFLEAYIDNRVCALRDKLDSDQSNIEKIDSERDDTMRNKKYKKIEVTSIDKIKKNRKGTDLMKGSKNKSLETIKQRAAEINMEKINRFRGLIKQKTVNSASVIKELRNLNRFKLF